MCCGRKTGRPRMPESEVQPLPPRFSNVLVLWLGQVLRVRSFPAAGCCREARGKVRLIPCVPASGDRLSSPSQMHICARDPCEARGSRSCQRTEEGRDELPAAAEKTLS